MSGAQKNRKRPSTKADLGVPVLLLIAFQGREDERQHSRPLLRHQADDVLIVPQEQRPLRHLHACARTWPQSAHCTTVMAPTFPQHPQFGNVG